MLDAFTLGLLLRLPGLFHFYTTSRASPLSTTSGPTVLTMRSTPFHHCQSVLPLQLLLIHRRTSSVLIVHGMHSLTMNEGVWDYSSLRHRSSFSSRSSMTRSSMASPMTTFRMLCLFLADSRLSLFFSLSRITSIVLSWFVPKARDYAIVTSSVIVVYDS